MTSAPPPPASGSRRTPPPALRRRGPALVWGPLGSSLLRPLPRGGDRKWFARRGGGVVRQEGVWGGGLGKGLLSQAKEARINTLLMTHHLRGEAARECLSKTIVHISN